MHVSPSARSPASEPDLIESWSVIRSDMSPLKGGCRVLAFTMAIAPALGREMNRRSIVVERQLGTLHEAS